MKYSPNLACPCHSGVKYKRCCRPLHRGAAAETPDTLMRSRYAAFSLGLASYVMETTYPRGAAFEPDAAAWEASILEFSEGTDFVGLSILETSADNGALEAWVTFRASLTRGGRDLSFTEKSRFVWELGRWAYDSGEISKPTPHEPDVSRGAVKP